MRGDDATDDSGARFGWTPLADDDAAGSKMSRPTIDRTRPTDASDSTIDPPRLSLFAQLASIERDRSGASQPTATAGDEAEHEPADVPPRLTEHDDRAPIASAHEIAPERAPIATHARPRTPTVSSPPAPTTAATDAPVIRVTIGRIDVRAVTPPAPQAAPPAPPLRLTLDEYLRQRNGRQR